MIEFYQSFARGGAGIVTIGDSAIDFDYANGHFHQLNLGDDRVITGLGLMAEAIQKYGAKVSIELDHAGRLSSPRVLNGKNPIGPSPVPSAGELMAARLEGREPLVIQEMDQAMIDQVIDNFASACERCLAAGFEMVMLHGGHGQLLSQFVSPVSNKRTDKYGGSLANRARFVIEVLTAIRQRVGNRLALEYRISGDEMVPDGLHLEETIEFIRLIQDKIDLVHVSLAGIIDPKYITHMAQPTYFPHAYNVHRAESIKKAVNIPVTTVGSILTLALADEIIAGGQADIVAMGRAHVADPAIVNKSYSGDLDDIRPCLRCNECGERPANFMPPRCAVNPVIGREAEYRNLPPAVKPKRIAIVGGGPAGMEAALTASSRGHQVTLYEKEKELGGALRYAAAPSFKADMKRYLDWMAKQTLRSPVTVKTATEANAATVRATRPDALIVAAGAEPIIPDVPGVNRPNVVWAGHVDTNEAPTGAMVVVAGAGLTGCETALHLALAGKQVTVIDMVNEAGIAGDANTATRMALVEQLEQQRQTLHIPGMAIAVVKDDEVVLTHGFGVTNVETETPVTPETIFAIGSSTKAFTSTLVGMLVDEGEMDWDDAITDYLPYFTMDIESDHEDAEIALRDLLSHRTGFVRMGLLFASGEIASYVLDGDLSPSYSNSSSAAPFGASR